MRAIKFRAWDKEKKRFFEPEGYSEDALIVYLNGDMGVLDNEPYESIHSDEANKRFVLLQYTGLNDKNGVEIYEGDIVEQKKQREQYRLFEIKWDRGNMGFYFSHAGTNFIEVIGNVYENPDLLKGR